MNGMGETDGSRAEAEQQREIEQLREAVRARDEFVSIAAHELRNPMTPIVMLVEGILAMARTADRCTPEILVPRIELLERAVSEFVRRATALLDVSRVAAGNVRIEPSETDLSWVVSKGGRPVGTGRSDGGLSGPAGPAGKCYWDVGPACRGANCRKSLVERAEIRRRPACQYHFVLGWPNGAAYDSGPRYWHL